MSRIRKTATAVFLGRGIMALRQIILVPILLRQWGVEYYGHWLVITAIPAFLSMSNLGLGMSGYLRISIDLAGGDLKEAWRTMVTTILSLLALGSAMLLAALLWMYLKPPDVGSFKNGSLVVIFLIAALFLRMLAQPLFGWWTGFGMPARYNQLANFNSLFELILTASIPLFGGGAIHVAASILALNVSWLAYVCFELTGLLRKQGVQKGSLRPDLKLGRQMLFSGLGHQLGPLWQALLFQGSLVMASTLLGPAGAALWGSLRAMSRCGNQMLELISQSLGPEIQIAYGMKDNERMHYLHSMGLACSFLLSSLTGLSLFLLGPTVFKYWTHGAFEVSVLNWAILGFGLVPFAFWWISGEVHRSSNRPWTLNIVGTIAALMSLGFTWILPNPSIFSFSLGLLLFDVIMAIVILPITFKFIGDNALDGTLRGFKGLIALIKSRFYLLKIKLY